MEDISRRRHLANLIVRVITSDALVIIIARGVALIYIHVTNNDEVGSGNVMRRRIGIVNRFSASRKCIRTHYIRNRYTSYFGELYGPNNIY